MLVKDYKCFKDKIVFQDNPDDVEWTLDGIEAVDDWEKMVVDCKDEDASSLSKIYKNVRSITVKGICDLNAGVLATAGLLKVLEKNNINIETSTSESGKEIVDLSNTITVLDDYSKVLPNGGFIGTFQLTTKI